MDQALSAQLGAIVGRAVRARERRPVRAARRLPADAAEPDQRGAEVALPQRAAAARRADRRPERAQSLRRHRPGRHQLDRGAQGCRARSVRDVGARGRARAAEGPARARDHARLAQGVPPHARSQALEAMEAMAPAHARGAEIGGARRGHAVCDRDHGDRQPVPAGTPDLPRDHQPRSADRRCRRDQCRICPVPHLQQQNGRAQDLS